jgi:hypothetical protein
VFCGAGAVTKEHVFPAWVGRHLQLPRGSYLSRSRKGTPIGKPYGPLSHTIRDADIAQTQVKRACGGCNNGWMSQLEKYVKPILLPMINGDETLLAEDEVRAVARWAHKTAIMVGYLNAWPGSTAEERAQVMSSAEPPLGVAVYAGLAAVSGLMTNTHLQIRMAERSAPSQIRHGYSVLLRMGHLIVVVFRMPPEMVTSVTWTAPTEGVVRLWPASDLGWPPKGPRLTEQESWWWGAASRGRRRRDG